MRSEVTTVTPVLAKEWLQKNIRNRAVNLTRVERYCDDLKHGRFKLNGQPIIFGLSGNLLDGQHRLKAIEKTGIPMTTLVVFGVDDATFDTIDTGRVRQSADVLSIDGQTNAVSLAAAAKWVLRYETGRIAISEWSIQEVREAVRAHPELAGYVSKAKTIHNRAVQVPPGLAAALWYLFARLNSPTADWFFERLYTGSGLDPSDPVYVLRETVIRNHVMLKRSSSGAHVAMVAIIIKAWNATIKGEQVKLLRFVKDEAFPRIG